MIGEVARWAAFTVVVAGAVTALFKAWRWVLRRIDRHITNVARSVLEKENP